MPPFAHAEVLDVMHFGLISCTPDTPLEHVARIMATNRIHAVVVSALGAAHDQASAWAIVSDLDIARFAWRTEGQTAGSVASTDFVTVAADERLERAAQIMAEHEASHLVVTHATSGHPVGVLSTLDLAAVIASV